MLIVGGFNKLLVWNKYLLEKLTLAEVYTIFDETQLFITVHTKTQS
jgi:hypothetical protein